jgi:hypothetical protein
MGNLELNNIMKQDQFDNTKGIIRIRNSKKDRQHNGQKKNDKQRSTKHTHKTKDRVTRTALTTGVNSGAPEELVVPVYHFFQVLVCYSVLL